MRLHFIRNATMVIEIGAERVVLDPMLGPKGSLPPFALFRHRARKNPTVELPPHIESVLNSATAGLITHCHYGFNSDHLDRAGTKLLTEKRIPVYCNRLDEKRLRKRGLATIPLDEGKAHDFAGGKITPFAAEHGYAVMSKLMGPGVGYFIQVPKEPSLYISGDTVLTPVVKQVLAECKPDISVLAAGSAQMDFGKPILMPMSEMLEFIRQSPGLVIANHLEALNHCPVTREDFRKAVAQAGFAAKTRVPEDGEVMGF
jgi:L-ascorbate metabolism protein UlaG (beta-lactamase superfamily)